MSFVTIGRQRGQAFVQAVLAQDAAQLAAQEAELARRVRQEVGRLKAEAVAEGRAAGEAEGLAAMAPHVARVEAALAVLNAALGQLAAPLAAKEAELAGLVTELGFVVGRHLAGVELSGSPAGVQALVGRLLAEAASARGAAARLRLRVSPADAASLAAQAGGLAVALLEDPGIAAGGVVLELLDEAGDAAPLAAWDATLARRIAAMRIALGLPPEGDTC
jgi:flagellar assembly protein FliH